MPNYLELIYNPRKFFSDLKEEEIGFLPSFSFVLASAILSTASALVTADLVAKATVRVVTQGLPAEQAQAIYTITYYSTIILPFIFTFLIWLIFSAILHGISAIFDGEGSFSTTMKFIGFCFLPNILLFPINFKIALDTAAILSVEGIQGLARDSIRVASASLSTITIGWQLLLWGFAIMYARGLDARRAFTTAAIPTLIYLAITWFSLLKL
jgi:hypothetical protein